MTEARTFYAHLPPNGPPDVAAPRREILNQAGVNDICEATPRGTAAVLVAHLAQLDRINHDLGALIERTQAIRASNTVEREHAARELALINREAA